MIELPGAGRFIGLPWVSQKLADGRTYAVELGGEPGGASLHFMPDAAKIDT